MVPEIERKGDCCAGNGLSFTTDGICDDCFSKSTIWDIWRLCKHKIISFAEEEDFISPGSEFYLAFPFNFFPSVFFSRANIRMAVGAMEGEAEFMVQTRERMTTYQTERNSSTEIGLPPQLRVRNAGNRDGGVFVKAMNGEQLSVIAINEELTSADTFRVLPCVYLPDDGYEYYAVSVPAGFDEGEDDDGFIPEEESAFIIIATEDDTLVTIILTVTVDISVATDLNLEKIEAGKPETVVLQRLQTLYITSPNDLTGSRVISNKPIAFITGHECGTVPSRMLYCDHLLELVPPTATWGKRFITAPIATRRGIDLFKIIASRDDTVFSGSCANAQGDRTTVMEVSLNAGEADEFDISSTDFCYFESTEPVNLFQFSVASVVDNVSNADPFMVIVPPVEQYQHSYVISTFESQAIRGNNYMNVFVPSEYEPFGVRIDGSVEPVERSTVVDIPCVPDDGESICGHAFQISIEPGTHFITHTDPDARISVTVYWLAFRAGHGYFGGMTQRPIACECT